MGSDQAMKMAGGSTTLPLPGPPPATSWALPRLLRLGSAIGWTCLGLLFAIASATMLRWMAGGDPSMKFNAAIALVVFAAALGGLRAGLFTRWVRLVSTAAGAVPLLVGSLTLAEWVFHWNLRIDELLVRDAASRPGLPPGRPAPQAASALICLALGLMLHTSHTARLRRLREGAALLVLGLASVALLGHVAGATALFLVGGTYPFRP